MKLNYELIRKCYANPFEGGKYAKFLEDTLQILDEQSFVINHDVFYSKGMFNDMDLEIYFFTKKTFHAVKIEAERMLVKSWNVTEVQSVELIIPDRFNLELVISLKDGEKIKLNSKTDSNTSWSERLKDAIKEIHNLMTSD